jgi:uncharacterized protein (TIGR04255 family)
MAEERHLSNAPITEALVDLRVQLDTSFDPSSFEQVKGQLAGEFPVAEELHLVEGTIRIAGKQVSQTASDKRLHGYVFRSKDKDRVVQFRQDGFTFNKLKPYTSWEKVFTEAWDLWQVYVASSAPLGVTRIAVRYVNHLSFSFPCDFGQYLTDPPSISDGAPTQLTGYFKRASAYDPDSKTSANIVQALERSTSQNAITLILDIDVYRTTTFEPSDAAIVNVFAGLRDMKNRMFFGAITERTAEMYE